MRFFKAFNLLHRRTKSATFVPGVSAHTLDFPTVTTDLRSSSFTVREGCHNAAPLSLFDLVTSNQPPIPVNFNHLHDTSDRVLGIWRSRRNSDRNSLASLQSSVNKEISRLSEAVNFWILEYTKIQNLLRDCHEELVAERLKTVKLEKVIEEVRKENTTLSAPLDLHQKDAGNTNLTGFSGDTSRTCQTISIPDQKNQVILYPRTQLPSTSSGSDSLSESIKPRTLDEYSFALRMTLMARKELRDQKKITKFWKNIAVTVDEHHVITPSVSTISSIRDVIPSDRQAAVQALISRRALSAELKVETTSATTYNTRAKAEDVVPEKVACTLTSSLSKTSGFSGLGPLASESMKQEINILFGSSSIPRRLASSPTRQNGSLEVSRSTSSKGELLGNINHSISIESFEDISMIFQRAFGVDSNSKSKTVGQLSKDSGPALINIHLPNSISSKELIASSSSGCLPISSLTSTYSQVWVNVESPKPETDNTVVGNSHATINAPHQTIKLASKECTSRRSWQRYMSRSSIPNRRSGEDQLPSKEIVMQKPAEGKENSGFSMSLPAFKKRNSRLPVPVFTPTGR
ncbi:hypothetical protein CVT25_015479 [Psilocybe cyanescens]|uniref:Uncharacterized protein n=1 Tax=Psilocybe cyanescens TaxID=93625 RepID=A0A409WHZ1_PSICY|nr:hypothetical protein CVT25_015479 [Psilocybe cyanescens]